MIAGDLSSRSDADLVTLLRNRPDLAHPAPRTVEALAARALSPGSLRRALDGLDRAHLAALEAAIVAADLPPGTETDVVTGRAGSGSGAGRGAPPAARAHGAVTTTEVATLLGCAPTSAEALLADLHTRALILLDGTGVGVPGPLLEVVGPVADLAPTHPDDAEIRRRLHVDLEAAGGTVPVDPPRDDPDDPRRRDATVAPVAPVSPVAPDAAGDADPGARGSRSPSDVRTSHGGESGRGTRSESALAALTDGSPAGAREVLARLTWGPAEGRFDPDGPLGPAVRHLVAHGSLRLHEADPGAVTLPRPVALALRGGRLWQESPIAPPPATPRPVRDLDASAGAQAGDVLTLVEEIATAWGEDPPRALRGGGLSVRDLAATTRLVGLDTPLTALILEVGHAAGLLGRDGGNEPVWAPTKAYDTWLDADDAHRWAVLALAWRDLPRAPGRVGGRGDSGPIKVFTPEVTVGAVLVDLRRRVLSVLADLDPGLGLGEEDVLARLRWASPRLPDGVAEQVVHDTLAEAEVLGVSVGRAIAAPGRALLTTAERDHDADVRALGATLELPDPVDHLYLQADLTAIAPGRLDTRTATFLRLAADLESRGGGATYRFSSASVRRLLDAGWEVDDVLQELTRLSRSGVPQPLEFLVRDAARGYGAARVGSCRSYLRSDDVAALDALLARPEAAPARLRRLAPTVLVSSLAGSQLRTLLRGVDVHAVIEGVDGTVAPDVSAPARALVPRAFRYTPPAPPDVEAVVAALRSSPSDADAGRGAGTAPASGSDPEIVLSRLRQAAAEGTPMRIGVVHAGGQVITHAVRVTHVADGRVGATDLITRRPTSWPISHVTDVSGLHDPRPPVTPPRRPS